MPGVLKNTLDWIVGSGELIDKAIALVNASLAETLGVMSGRLIGDASMVVPVPKGVTAGDLVADPALSATLRSVIRALIDERIERERTRTADDQCREAGE